MTWVHIDTTTPTARTNHTCDYCYRTIHTGEVYEVDVGIEPGEGWTTHRTCIHCHIIYPHVAAYIYSYWDDVAITCDSYSEYLMDTHPEIYTLYRAYWHPDSLYVDPAWLYTHMQSAA